MKIFEIQGSQNLESERLVALLDFLEKMAKNSASKGGISTAAFIEAAQDLRLNVNERNIDQILTTPPISNIIEPFNPGTKVIHFKGDAKDDTATMPVDQARDIVAKNAQSAMKKGMK